MTNEVCEVCDRPSIITINVTGITVGSCSAHFFKIMDEQVALLAIERGIPIDVARRLAAKVIREAMRHDVADDA